MIKIVRAFALLVILLCVSLQARQDPSRRSNPQETQPNSKQLTAAEQQATTEALRDIGSSLRAINERAAEAERNRANQEPNQLKGALAPEYWSNWALFLIGIGGIIAAFQTLGKMERQTVAAEIAAGAAKTSADVARDTLVQSLAHTRTIERAYVTLHHDGGIGARIEHLSNGQAMYADSDPVTAGFLKPCKTEFLLTNQGNTPSRVTDTWIDLYVGYGLPKEPAYVETPSTKRGTRAYLVKAQYIRILFDFRLKVSEVKALSSGAIPVWLYGYVDYIDAFSVRHRAGYARRISSKSDETRIVDMFEFNQHGLEIDAVASPYNYDRLRVRDVAGEGNDWD